MKEESALNDELFPFDTSKIVEKWAITVDKCIEVLLSEVMDTKDINSGNVDEKKKELNSRGYDLVNIDDFNDNKRTYAILTYKGKFYRGYKVSWDGFYISTYTLLAKEAETILELVKPLLDRQKLN